MSCMKDCRFTLFQIRNDRISGTLIQILLFLIKYKDIFISITVCNIIHHLLALYTSENVIVPLRFLYFPLFYWEKAAGLPRSFTILRLWKDEQGTDCDPPELSSVGKRLLSPRAAANKFHQSNGCVFEVIRWNLYAAVISAPEAGSACERWNCELWLWKMAQSCKPFRLFVLVICLLLAFNNWSHILEIWMWIIKSVSFLSIINL